MGSIANGDEIGKISKLDDRSTEITQFQQESKMIKKKKNSLGEVWDNDKIFNILLIGVQERHKPIDSRSQLTLKLNKGPQIQAQTVNQTPKIKV